MQQLVATAQAVSSIQSTCAYSDVVIFLN